MNAKDLALAVPLIGALFACGYSNDDRDIDDDSVDPLQANVAGATIDVGAGIDATPGEGAGAFVEYQGDGRWRIFVSCDTAVSDFTCLWDIIVTPHEGSLDDLEFDGADSSDFLGWERHNSARFVAETDFDLDGFTVRADPGATLRVDVFLDDVPAPRYIYWVADGGLNRGAPTNPVDLTPSAP